MQQKRHRHSMTGREGLLLISGGSDGSGVLGSVEILELPRLALRKGVKGLKQVRQAHASCFFNEWGYVFCGLAKDRVADAINLIERYSLIDNRWESLESKLRPSFYMQAQVVGDRVILFGGKNEEARDVLIEEGKGGKL